MLTKKPFDAKALSREMQAAESRMQNRAAQGEGGGGVTEVRLPRQFVYGGIAVFVIVGLTASNIIAWLFADWQGVLFICLPEVFLLLIGVVWGVWFYSQHLKKQRIQASAKVTPAAQSESTDGQPTTTPLKKTQTPELELNPATIIWFIKTKLGGGSIMKGAFVSAMILGGLLFTMVLCGAGLWLTSQIGLWGLGITAFCLMIWLVLAAVLLLGTIFPPKEGGKQKGGGSN